MDPVFDSDWLPKIDLDEGNLVLGNIVTSWQMRERGIDPINGPPNKTILEHVAEDALVQKDLTVRSCDLPGYPRSSFLMAFSPDGTKVASTHGNHNIYVSELSSGKHVRILRGHPRTPWCIAFHPSHPQLIGSGCLGGQVRVWDLSGGSEAWNVDTGTEIASIAFHPRDQLLVIATFNELYFWDWSQDEPFLRISTKTFSEKVRYVAFDSLGCKLITGISTTNTFLNMNSSREHATPQQGNNSNNQDGNRRDPPTDGSGETSGDRNRPENSRAAQDTIVNSYQHLVQRYDNLVRNYQRLFMARHNITNATPASTTDRGTDPMETEFTSDTQTASGPEQSRSQERIAPQERSTPQERNRSRERSRPQERSRIQERTRPQERSRAQERTRPLERTRPQDRSRPQERTRPQERSRPQSRRDRHENGERRTERRSPLSLRRRRPSYEDGGPRNSRLLNLDILSFNNPSSSRSHNTNVPERPHLWARPLYRVRESAFQPIGDNPEQRLLIGIPERNITRLLPNPFSPRSGRTNTASSTRESNNSERNTSDSPSRTRSSQRSSSMSTRMYLQRRCGAIVLPQFRYSRSTSTATQSTSPSQTPSRSTSTRSSTRTSSRSSTTRTSTANNASGTPRPSTSHSSSQVASAQTIHESLDLIRDILRDSGTRLLNLITNVSLTTLANAERRRRNTGSAHSDDNTRSGRAATRRPRVRLFSSSALRPHHTSSGSDSDSDHSLEVNIYRTRNSSFPEDGTGPSTRTQADNDRPSSSANRMVINLNIEDDSEPNEETSRETPSENPLYITVVDNRFRVRSQNNNASSSNANNQDNESQPRQETPVDYNRPSTSRDTSWMGPLTSASRDPVRDRSNERRSNRMGAVMSSRESYAKIKTGVVAIEKLRIALNRIWIRGQRPTSRELRKLWDDLRRNILCLQRQSGPDMLRFVLETTSDTLANGDDDSNRPNASSTSTSPSMARPGPSCEPSTSNGPSTSSQPTAGPSRERAASFVTPNASRRRPRTRSEGDRAEPQPGTSRDSPTRRDSTGSARTNRIKIVTSFLLRKKLQSMCRAGRDDLRRRIVTLHNLFSGRSGLRNLSRHTRRESLRSFELHCSRNEIKLRAMQILSILFNIMMGCLDERGLSNVIIIMLRSLKKALALSNYLLHGHRFRRERERPDSSMSEESTVDVTGDADNPSSEPNEGTDEQSTNVNASEQTPSANDAGDTNMDDDADGDDDPNSSSSWSASDSDEPMVETTIDEEKRAREMETGPSDDTPNPQPGLRSQRWSDRLAVQISAANRNFSLTARSRRDLYLESQRQRALHRCNPATYPFTKRKVMPPRHTYRIPAVRYAPSKAKPTPKPTPNPTDESNEPVAGPSNVQQPAGSHPPRDGNLTRSTEPWHDFQDRMNIYNIARVQAVRMRSATRNRFRRLHSIRLYAPTSLRDMLLNDNPPADNQNNNGEPSPRRPFVAYRPHILAARNEALNREGNRGFESILNNVAVPFVHINDLPVNDALQAHSLPRVQEYLQPIILAQNALVLNEGGGGGGLLDGALFQDALPTPLHRVQAWDFTNGCPPDISDSTKNIVVSRCKIHNDASIDISKDGRLLVALLPVPRLRSTNHRLGVFSLEWNTLGQCLHTAALEQSAVSVALSPTARYLAVGLGSRRFTTLSNTRNNVFALLFKLAPFEHPTRTDLAPVKELKQDWEQVFTSLNCLRWAPEPGQGLVYANNAGQLIIMS